MLKRPHPYPSPFLNSPALSRRWLRSGIALVLSILTLSQTGLSQQKKWVGTWSTAPQLVEPNNNPPSPGLSNNTLRQVLRISLGGDTLRMRFSNEFSTSPVTLQEVHLAVSAGQDTIDPATDTALRFNGNLQTTMGRGSAVTSDPFYFPGQPGTDLVATIYFGSTSADVTGHPGSRTTSYILTGNQISRGNFAGAVRTDHWYVINTIDVLAPDSAAAVVIIGNSITDGRGSGTNRQNRWPDELSRRFQENPQTHLTAVLNQGIGGNCVLGSCLGPSALSRFGRDVLGQSGVRWLIIFEGINDIGNGAPGVGNNLINAYTQMIQSAHANGIFVYGATLLPMKNSFYYTPEHETERQIVNNWIKTTNLLDGVIDLDLALRNPADTLSLLPEADTGDHLHPNETGHRLMAEAVDLNLFVGRDSLTVSDASLARFFEPECATIGENWNIVEDAQASDGKYVTAMPGFENIANPPADSSDALYIPFQVDSAGSYNLIVRINCPTYDDDSFWIKMDDGNFELHNGLVTGGWEWRNLNAYTLGEGPHTLTIAFREDGALLDKICLATLGIPPLGLGEEAENACLATGLLDPPSPPSGYALEPNFPNPFNPSTLIRYRLPEATKVRLTVFNSLGQEVQRLVGEHKNAGRHEIEWDGTNDRGKAMSSGIYYCTLSAGSYRMVRKMVLLR
ncbi:MAG TPA: GDSL-type esterase/lipase family protein [Calditrichia bacterium]|nr:GDSL-type esterase/lipase family protein [Calditrichia bacterium]